LSRRDPETIYYRRLLTILAVSCLTFVSLQALTVLACEAADMGTQAGWISDVGYATLIRGIFQAGHLSAMAVLFVSVAHCLLAMLTVMRQRPVGDGLLERRMISF